MRRPDWSTCVLAELDEAFNQSLQAAQSILNACARSWALHDIAEAMAKAGLFEQSLQVTQNFSDASDRSETLSAIAQAKADTGLLERAFEVAKDIETNPSSSRPCKGCGGDEKGRENQVRGNKLTFWLTA